MSDKKYTIWQRYDEGNGWKPWVPTVFRDLTKEEAQEKLAELLAYEAELRDEFRDTKAQYEIREQ